MKDVTNRFSCGRCKGIQLFDKGACTVCGWQLASPVALITPSFSAPSNPKPQSADDGGCLTLVLALGCGGIFYAGFAIIFLALLVWAFHYLFG